MNKEIDELKKQYDVVERYDDDFIRVRKDGRFGIVDRFNNIIIPLEYDSIILLVGEGFDVQKNGKFGCFGLKGEKILDCEYDEIEKRYGSYLVKKDGACGVVRIDDNGEKEEFVLDNVEEIMEYGTYPQKKYNLFKVKRKGKWGYINREGKEIIPCEYELLQVPTDLVSDAIVMIPGRYFDLDERYVVREYFDDQNFYRVLMHLLKNNLALAWESRNLKTIQQFLKDAKYCIDRYFDVIPQVTDSEISKAGLSALQEFYFENIEVNEKTSEI